MTVKLRSLLTTVIGCFAIAGATHAATYNWSTSFGDCTYGSTVASTNNWSNQTCTSPSVTNSSGTAVSSTLDVDVAGLSWTGPVGALVQSWGSNGLGVDWSDADGHTIDNAGKVDSIVLRFNEAVTMNQLSIGWKDGDADIQVFAWTGAAPSYTTTLPTSLTSGGWTSVAQLSDVSVGSHASFTPNTSSSYWLVAALGGDNNVDSFKLLSIAGFLGSNGGGSVPEPGSLILLGLGAVGLLAARRKATASN